MEKKNSNNNWSRIKKYLNISEKYAETLRSASLITISFLTGFIFYGKIFRDFSVDNDHDCWCVKVSKMQRKQLKTNKPSNENLSDHDPIPKP
ncbi:hypothetical protein ABEB36_008220 [Hypothenemus hampei]|uniref:Uncharacterized protein n=1 Tax=Hypothenemus hampei TaxID=57062 RepID=A0ABD1EL58_HYPHA